jgi:hypothetical protein
MCLARKTESFRRKVEHTTEPLRFSKTVLRMWSRRAWCAEFLQKRTDGPKWRVSMSCCARVKGPFFDTFEHHIDDAGHDVW